MKDLHITVLTRTPLGQPDVALPLLKVIAGAHEELRPDRYGSFEPLRGRLSLESDIIDVIAAWRAPMLFSNGHRSNMAMWFGNRATHNSIRIDCVSSRISPDVVTGLTRHLAVASDADVAMAYFWGGGRDEWISRYKAVYPMCLGPTTHDIKRSLPDLAWYSVWGPPYVVLFGRDRLSSCPSFRSGPVASERWEVQLTEEASSEDFAIVQETAKAHLGNEHFLDLTAPGRQQRTPAFDWSPAVPNALETHLRDHGLLEE